MTVDWAATLPMTHAIGAAPLRSRPGVEVCPTADLLWVHGGNWDEDLDRTLRSMWGCVRYRVMADGRVMPIGRMVPTGRLPEGPWSPLVNWLTPTLPPAAMPRRADAGAAFRLVRDSAPRTSNLLRCRFEVWHDYAAAAPRLRLERVSFAVSEDGSALVRGEPLPPIPGCHFVEHDGVATPAGWRWSPTVDATVVRTVLGSNPEDVAILDHQGIWQIVPADGFVRATHSAVRLTAAEAAG